MTGMDTVNLARARGAIPPGTRINVTFLGHEDLAQRLAAARAVREYGFVPVPHISARRIESEQELAEFLAALQAVGASENLFVVAGDPAQPARPYGDTLSLLHSGKLEQYGVRRVSVAGYPEGHRFLRELAGAYHPRRHGDIKLHFYTFGGLAATAEWISEFRRSQEGQAA